jgi:hypothetical protein
LKKKNEPKLPVQKLYEPRFGLVQRISTWYKSTFRRFRDPSMLDSRKLERFSFYLPFFDTWDQENTDFELEEGRERVGGSEV